MARNSNLSKAKSAKNDEFYTQMTDIEKELRHYKEHFKNKIIFCNCDDPEWSNFWRYFELNFDHLGLKKLISTHFDREKPSYKLELYRDIDGSLKTLKTSLKQNGDFRSEECVEMLKECDVVVTNPPFSLFREYVGLLMEYGKKFVILGNMNAITYKEIFPLIKDNKIWPGYGFNKTMEFEVPENYKAKRIAENGKRYTKVPAITWYTNLDIKKRHEPLILYREYHGHEDEYPHYDNYDAINVDKTKDIPMDYIDVMGVPISFLDKFCPEQFEIVGLLQSSTDEQAGIKNLRYYDNFKEMRQDMSYTGASGKKANGNPVLAGKSVKGNFLYCNETNQYVHSLYARIVIRIKYRE